MKKISKYLKFFELTDNVYRLGEIIEERGFWIFKRYLVRDAIDYSLFEIKSNQIVCYFDSFGYRNEKCMILNSKGE